MRSDDQLYHTSEYWVKVIQNDLSVQVERYMTEKGLNQAQLAKELGVTKTFITQVLKGNANYSLGKLIDLSLAVGVVPQIEFKPIQQYLLQVEKKGAKRQINLTGSGILPMKGGKTKLPVQRNENGIAVSLDVHQVNTITPSDTKIA